MDASERARALWVRKSAGHWHPLCCRGQQGGAMNKEKGAIGYILLWLLGVPATLLFLIFILRGCN